MARDEDIVQGVRASLPESIGANAAEADDLEGDLGRDIAALHEAGWLTACLPATSGGRGWGSEHAGAVPALDALRRIGRANLSVARLFEGHMNAVKLIAVLAAPGQREEVFTAVREGELLGVWGADDPGDAVRRDASGQALRGAKRFASGLGLVQQAVVTVTDDRREGQGTRLAILRVTDAARMDAKPWQMAGMQATRSGRYDFTGVSITSDDWLGEPDAYYREPHFEGGIWRYCAAHLGAAEALFAHYRDGLVRSSRAEDPHQQRRIAECAIALESTRLWLVRAAQAVEADGASSNTATLSLLAREATADNCRLVIERVEAGLGMAAFAQGTPIERIARDLRVFLCQANPDGKRVKAAAALIDGKFLPADL